MTASSTAPTPVFAAIDWVFIPGLVPIEASSYTAETDDLALLVDVEACREGRRRQAGHGPHVAADRVDGARPHRGTHLAHGQDPAGRRSLELGIRRDREVRFGDAHRQPPETVRLECVQLLDCGRIVLDPTRSVDAHRDGLDLLAQGGRVAL